MRNATIRVQTYGGTWETMGVERASNIVPENVKYSADQNGSSAASFDLKRETGVMWPDLSAFTPVEIHVDGALVWSGRIKETPTSESPSAKNINVQCEGWQFHLDDDVYEKFYVRTRLADWRDAREFPTATITPVGTAAGQVTSDRGAITLGWPKGAQIVGGSSAGVGVVLDLGQLNKAKRIIIDWQKIGTTATAGLINFKIRGHDSEDAFSPASFEDAYNIDVTSLGASGTRAFTFTTARRYVSIALFYVNGASGTLGEDNLFRIVAAQIFGDTAYESGNTSILKASTVWQDSVAIAPNLNQDLSKITTTSFSIPDFSISTPTTPRAAQDAVNAFHDYQRYVDVDKRLNVRARPSAPLLTAASNARITIEDASSNSGDDIYNRVVITGDQANGTPLWVARHSGEQNTSSLIESVTPTPTNPSFDTNTTGWTPQVLTITRDTGVFDSSPASGRWAHSSAADSLWGAFTGTFKKGTTYVLDLMLKVDTGTRACGISFGGSGNGGVSNSPITVTTTWTVFRAKWTPLADTAGSNQNLILLTPSDGVAWNMYVDSLRLYAALPTLADRRGFQRTKLMPLGFPTTTVAATQLADTYLTGHLTTPFKGTVQGKGTDSFLNTMSGENVPAHLLTLYTGELLRLPDRVDPDTGAWGREGRIANVDVDLNEDAATVTLDNTRSNFEAFLARLEVVTNTRLGG